MYVCVHEPFVLFSSSFVSVHYVNSDSSFLCSTRSESFEPPRASKICFVPEHIFTIDKPQRENSGVYDQILVNTKKPSLLH